MAKRLGRQKPTVWATLPYEKTRGAEAIEIYEMTGRKAQEWQVNLVNDILAVNDDDLWTHASFGYSVPRRNGKNEIAVIIELFALFEGEKVLHTAHLTTTSSSAAARLAECLDGMGYEEVKRKAKDEVYTHHYTYRKQLGLEVITLLCNGCGSVSFRTRTSRGGLGEGYDRLIVDEAQEYETNQDNTLKYVISDSSNPQKLMCGTPPTAVSKGDIFKKYRDNVLAGEAEDSGWAEWSVSEKSDPYNVDLWYECNPSLGTIFTERSVKAEIGDDVLDFNIQRLGLWIDYNLASAITEADWKMTEVLKIPKLSGKTYLGVKFGKDGTNVSVSIACKTKEGKVFISAYDCRNNREGVNWILSYMMSVKSLEKVVIDGAGGQQILADAMRANKMKKPIIPTVSEVIRAFAEFEQALYNDGLVHMPQPSLDMVVTNCDKRPIGANGGFGYRSISDELDISILESVVLAYWACFNGKEAKVQKVSY